MRPRPFASDIGISRGILKIIRGEFAPCCKLSAMSTPTDHPNPGLQRVLGPWMTTAIIIGTVIGSGVFKKPAAVAGKIPEFLPPMGVWVVWGLLVRLGALDLPVVAWL